MQMLSVGVISLGGRAMNTSRRILVVLCAVTMLMATVAVPAHAGADSTLLSRINASRAAAGKPPVEVYWDLTDDARAHTARMLADGKVYHNPSLSSVTGVWEALGENVGIGFDANQLHDAFMGSPGHRANILGDYNYVGIGTAIDDDGLVWATVIFMRAEPGLNGGSEPTTTTAATPSTTTTTTVAVKPPSTPAAADAPAKPTVRDRSASRPDTAPRGTVDDDSPAMTDKPRFPAYGRPDGLPAFAI
jgi:hypothetical protein